MIDDIHSNLPFRPAVGMMILNKNKEVFMGQRIDNHKYGWQMPQGGIDAGETPSIAAMRETWEEIGSRECYIIAETKKWYSYRIPVPLISKLWSGKYCGQKQKWFLMMFAGDDCGINIKTQHPEFSQWKWVKLNRLLKESIRFKVKLYKEVLREFYPLIKQL